MLRVSVQLAMIRLFQKFFMLDCMGVKEQNCYNTLLSGQLQFFQQCLNREL